EHRKKAFHIRNELVSKGLSVTVTLKSYSKFRKMLEKELKYADSNDIRYAIIVDDDTNDNNIIVKDLYEKKQKIMKFGEIIKIIMSRR
ncbi:MAG: hypothetical protein GWP09_00520, partial [Nitrospiraceae bacterium]|nr:hypothetical protein [Nitrospiraceae bacterium]